MSAGDDKTLKVEDLILRLFRHPLIALESLNSAKTTLLVGLWRFRYDTQRYGAAKPREMGAG